MCKPSQLIVLSVELQVLFEPYFSSFFFYISILIILSERTNQKVSVKKYCSYTAKQWAENEGDYFWGHHFKHIVQYPPQYDGSLIGIYTVLKSLKHLYVVYVDVGG